ncbi:tellurite resistance TerB family protein [Roseiconus lacunae]|uniref:TerB N-terminal domain-containing protein n=1 Tax=Roseiconus lacunae TaxID=2605694 RepID=A0ABT7PF44_9BACT|nr:TerB N-terminal domain-containing protein [Roseiconus lacunae]MDM4015114.1 TerB N-terminal domain-containing protein [Roseiconus lacunae]
MPTPSQLNDGGFAIPLPENEGSGERYIEATPKSNLQTSSVVFCGPGDSIKFQVSVGKGDSIELDVQDPLVYIANGPLHGRFDASLIDLSLPIASTSINAQQSLPYWPNYYDCSAIQRGEYLSWLQGGRRDSDVELGFVFIYFYGLERRVLIDRADYVPIANEVMRLLLVYGKSNSFRRYGTSLLWTTIHLASHAGELPTKLLSNAIRVTKTWTDETLGICLGILHSKSILLPSRLARTIAQRDARSSSSVIVNRHEEEFNKLFKVKYRERFGKGLSLDVSKRAKRVDYYPASGSLLRNLHSDENPSIPPRPDVFGKTAQFKPLIAIWEDSIESLRSFSREKKKSSGEITANVYESLPPELRQGEHPEEEAWLNAWERNVDEDDWPIVPVSELAAIKQIARRDRLTKTQCGQILATADVIGFGVEPDARITGKNYRWDEKVTLFFHDGNVLDDPTGYAAASVLLRLGASIAEADGSIDAEELNFINEHLQGQFNLSEAESKRLDRLQYLLLHSRSGDNTIGKALAKRLSIKHRRLVGEFLVGVAASDEVICKAEQKALRKAYRSLDLDEAELDQLIHRHETTGVNGDSQSDDLQLDLDAVSKIMAETHQVASLLRDAMADEDDDEIADESVSALSSTRSSAKDTAEPRSEVAADARFGSLDTRYHPLLHSILESTEWSSEAMRSLADEHGLMLIGAVEAINEWSTEEFGDWLIEEGETFTIHAQLIQEES